MDRKLSRIILCLAVTLIVTLGMAIPGLTEQAETGFGEEAYTSEDPETSVDGSGADRSADSGSEHGESSEAGGSASESCNATEEAQPSVTTGESSPSHAETDDAPQQEPAVADNSSIAQPSAEGDGHQREEAAGRDAEQLQKIVWDDAPRQETAAGDDAERQTQEPTVDGDIEQQTQEPTVDGDIEQQEQEPTAGDEAEQQEQEQEPVIEGDAEQPDAPVENEAPQDEGEATAEGMTIVGEAEEAVSEEDVNKEVVLSLLNEFLSRDPRVFDNELALIAARLSQKAYDPKALTEYLNKDLGFAPDQITTYNYGFARSYCFGMATMPYLGEGALPNSQILVLAIRGSYTYNELIKDSMSSSYKKRLGQDVIGVVETFYEEIEPKLPDFQSNGADYRILVTGHSLGGATANLAAAELNSAGQKNVFCYTFGAINSIKSQMPVTEGYENIHNVYNDLDTFSPSEYGSIMLNGAGTKYGKFGHLDDYTYEHRTEKQKNQYTPIQIANAVNHSMDNYVEDVAAGRVSCKVDDTTPILIPRRETWGEWFRGIGEKIRSKFGGNKKELNMIAPIPGYYNDKELTKAGVVFMGSDNPAIAGDLMVNKESFTDFLKTYAMATGDKVTYSAGKNVPTGKAVEIMSIDVMKELDGDHLVMIDVFNRSSQPVSLELSQLALNDAALDCGSFRSDAIPAREHMVVTIKAESLLELAGQSETRINVNDTLSFVLIIDDASGEEMYAFDAIEVPLELGE